MVSFLFFQAAGTIAQKHILYESVTGVCISHPCVAYFRGRTLQ